MHCITIGCENSAEEGIDTCRRCREEAGLTLEAAKRLKAAAGLDSGAKATGGGGFICDTPGSIARYSLLALRGALKLQTKGIKMSGGGSALQAVRSFGIRERTAKKALERFESMLRSRGILSKTGEITMG